MHEKANPLAACVVDHGSCSTFTLSVARCWAPAVFVVVQSVLAVEAAIQTARVNTSDEALVAHRLGLAAIIELHIQKYDVGVLVVFR